MKKIGLVVLALLMTNCGWAQVSPMAQSRAISGIPQQGQMNMESVLIALRHSIRDDHTRVVLEFNGKVTYKTEFKDSKYILTINGCRNLVPTNRSNPEGRDISKLQINSGPNRSGLILTFNLKQSKTSPTIEVVGDPVRLVISVPAGENKPVPSVASATVEVKTANQATTTKTITAEKTKEPEKPIELELPPEINIVVEPAKLAKKEFEGRSVVIDVGHGGNDTGVIVSGKPSEKNINLSVAVKLKSALEKLGFKAVLNRTGDTEMTQAQRIAFANKDGGDLYISIHTGGSNDTSKHGVSCYYFSPTGIFADNRAQGVGYDAVYDEWVKGARFNLAKYLAEKVNERLTIHLNAASRGVMGLPLKQLKFIVAPAVLVEVGMLTDSVDGKNLLSEKYHKAIAESIANAVVDFFNGIVAKSGE